jgi:hypothetical protein
MYNINWIKILMVAALALMIFAGTGAAVSLSNSGAGNWQNYIDITIKENSGGNLTDYQIPVLLSGGNFPPDARSDGADIRFIDAGEDELNYWIEKWDYENRVARIWVKVSRLNANSEGNIRMYYGNPSATSASNGEGTFEFFDDFGGTGIDQTKWHINYGTPVVSDGVLGIARYTTKSVIQSEAFRQYVLKKTNQNNIPDDPLFL